MILQIIFFIVAIVYLVDCLIRNVIGDINRIRLLRGERQLFAPEPEASTLANEAECWFYVVDEKEVVVYRDNTIFGAIQYCVDENVAIRIVMEDSLGHAFYLHVVLKEVPNEK